MLPPLPRCSNWAYSSLVSPSRISLPRKGCRVGLHIDLFEDCSAFTRVAARTLALSPIVTRYTEGFSHFVTSMTAPVASGWSDLAGWDSHPLESAALSRRTPFAVIHYVVRTHGFRANIVDLAGRGERRSHPTTLTKASTARRRLSP